MKVYLMLKIKQFFKTIHPNWDGWDWLIWYLVTCGIGAHGFFIFIMLGG